VASRRRTKGVIEQSSDAIVSCGGPRGRAQTIGDTGSGMRPADMATVTPVGATCDDELRPLSQAACGGARLRTELHRFECPRHGRVFLTREGIPALELDADGPRNDDPPVPVPRHPPRSTCWNGRASRTLMPSNRRSE